MGGQPYVYILHKEYAWHPAQLLKTEGKKATVKVPIYPNEKAIISDGGRGAKKSEEQVVDLKHYNANVLPLQNVDSNGDLIEFPDMVELPYLHEVRKRCFLCGLLSYLFSGVVYSSPVKTITNILIVFRSLTTNLAFRLLFFLDLNPTRPEFCTISKIVT